MCWWLKTATLNHSQGLRLLKEKPGITWQMGENGRRAFEKFYDWEFMTDRLAKLYQ